MDMEANGMIRPILIDGIAYLVPYHVDMEGGVQEWAEKQLEYAAQSLSDEKYDDWKDSYSQPGAQKRTKVNAINAHFDYVKAKGNHLEEELEKLPVESDRGEMRKKLKIAQCE